MLPSAPAPAGVPDTDPPTARASALPSAVALAPMPPSAVTVALRMNADTVCPLPWPISLIATDTPMEAETLRLDVDGLALCFQATETAPACAWTCDLSMADRLTAPPVETTPRPPAAWLSLMNACVRLSTALIEAAPASAMLLALPRAIAPPIEKASTTGEEVALSEMSSPAVTLAPCT